VIHGDATGEYAYNPVDALLDIKVGALGQEMYHLEKRVGRSSAEERLEADLRFSGLD
jgi:hypothetical protein